jgi:hypothetical protein
MKLHQIGLGDILRMLDALELPTEDQERAINLLGFAWLRASESAPTPRLHEQYVSTGTTTETDSSVPTPPIGPPENEGATPEWLERLKPIEPYDESTELPLQPPEIDDRENEAWIYDVMRAQRAQTPDWRQRVRPLAADNETIDVSPQPVEPLFPADVERSLLNSMLLRPARRRDIDVPRLLQLMANLEVLSKLPLRRRFSARGNVQVLLDQSRRMDPFAQDQRHIVKSLSRLLPDERLQVLRCQSWPPDDAKRSPRRGNYRYPPRGTLVLLISDLGQGGGLFSPHVPEPERWVDFARRLAAQGCAFLALSPVSSDRIDNRLSQHLEIIPWDRRFSIAAARVRYRRQDC